DQIVRQPLDRLNRTAQRDHLETCVAIEMDVQRRRDHAVAVVLDVGQLVGERARVVIVDEHEDTDRFAGLVASFFLHQLVASEVTHELAAVGVAPHRAEPVERAHQGRGQRHREPDDAVGARTRSCPFSSAPPTAKEFGFRTRALPRTDIFATYWFLDLSSELVFVGDDGTTEARGQSHREGVEFGVKVQPLDWLSFTGDFTYTTKAEFVDTGTPIPLAPIWTARADITVRLPWGVSSSFEMRYLGDRPADEERQFTALGYTLFNWTGRYRYRNLE